MKKSVGIMNSTSTAMVMETSTTNGQILSHLQKSQMALDLSLEWFSMAVNSVLGKLSWPYIFTVSG